MEREREREECRIVVNRDLACFSNVKIKIPSGVDTVTLFPWEWAA